MGNSPLIKFHCGKLWSECEVQNFIIYEINILHKNTPKKSIKFPVNEQESTKNHWEAYVNYFMYVLLLRTIQRKKLKFRKTIKTVLISIASTNPWKSWHFKHFSGFILKFELLSTLIILNTVPVQLFIRWK